MTLSSSELVSAGVVLLLRLGAAVLMVVLVCAGVGLVLAGTA